MNKANRLCLLFALISCMLTGQLAGAEVVDSEGSDGFLSRINLRAKTSSPPQKKIVVAIVDNGVRTTHISLKGLVWKNPFELAGNSIDDDGNGHIDDINGWDVADHNNKVSPPNQRLPEYFHGTHLAGVIAQVARAAYGERASEAVAIMPVKSRSDNAPNAVIRYGYKGIEYAIRAGADIVLCSWNVGHISSAEERILQKAKEKGVLVIASAGNFPDESEQYPAADDSVFAVAALDKNNKFSKHSNYGTFVDLSAPGVDIVSASALSDTAHATHDGTSQSAAIVAGAAAIMMAQSPWSSSEQIKACLKNESTLLLPESLEYAAKQGAGRLDVGSSLACLTSESRLPTHLSHPQGYLNLSTAKAAARIWSIEPAGKFKGIWFSRPHQRGDTVQASIDFYMDNSDTDKPFASFSLANMPDRFFVPGTKATIRLRTDSDRLPTKKLLMKYRAEAIKFRTLYCRDTAYLTEPGRFDDGSGSNRYSANSDCKWLITAPEGKVIHFKFNEFATEARKDLVYFFNGAGTHEKIMAIFSGPNIPPKLTTWQNKVLVWFVTNGEEQGQGWKGDISFIDKDKAQYPNLPKTEK